MPNQDGFGILQILKAEARDSGVYKCVMANSFNVIETEAVVTIYDIEEIEVKPTFTRITGEWIESAATNTKKLKIIIFQITIVRKSTI